MKKYLLIFIILITTTFTFSNDDDINPDDIRQQIYEFAITHIDTPYRWGSTGPDSFDCSGFVNYIYENTAHVNLPRVSYEMSKGGDEVNLEDLKIGDLVFFKTTKKNRISHVGIYIGENKFIHASSAKKKVIVSEIEGFYKKAFRVAKDFINKK